MRKDDAGPYAPANHAPFLAPGAPPLWLVLDGLVGCEPVSGGGYDRPTEATKALHEFLLTSPHVQAGPDMTS